ncbi:MAG: WD40 repeat domain-containing protein, partial [Patescibacteria group bacterium]|nr:WD40 repeat domain-containing protein [Patescibacteria group bacterium]
LPGTMEGIRALAFSPDGRRLAVVGFPAVVRVYDSESGRLEQELAASGGDLRAVAFSPDGRQLAAAGRDGTVRIWCASDGTPLNELAAGSRRVRAMEYSADGALLATGDDGGVVRVWNPQTGSLTAEFAPRPGRVMTLCFCGPDRLAVARSTNEIEIWSLGSQRPTSRLMGHTGSVVALTYQPQTGTLVSGGFDCTARIWDVQ